MNTTPDPDFMNTTAFQQAYSKMSTEQRIEFVIWFNMTYPIKKTIILTGVN